MITLHYNPGSASLAAHIVLVEAGADFELRLVDIEQGAHRSPQYLALNPNGRVPVLVEGDRVIYESAAICLHLADTHPLAKLAPPLGSDERAQFYQWLMWLTNTLQATLIDHFYPHRKVEAGNEEGARQVRSQAREQAVVLLRSLDARLASCGGPWLLGAQYTVADAYAFMLCRWTRNFPAHPARDFVHIAPWLQRVHQRPAVQRVLAAEELTPPY